MTNTLGYHPSILRAEKQALPIFSKIRVPAEVMISDFPDYRDKTVYIPHGLQKEQFDMPCSTPYASHKNMVSVGDMLFDATAIRCIAEMYPDWTIHLFGRGARLLAAPANVVTHGEKPFEDIIPYIRHADIGLAPYAIASNADYLSQSSMKMIQYTYSKIPIVAPNFAASGRPHVCGYVPGDKDSLYSAVQKAISYDRADIDNMNVMTWDQTVDRLLEGIIN